MQLRLREIRKAKGLTQKDVAQLTGLSQSYYSEMEAGSKVVSVDRLELIATKAFGVSPYELIVDTSRPEIARLISQLDKMTPEQRSLVLDLAKNLSGSDPQSD